MRTITVLSYNYLFSVKPMPQGALHSFLSSLLKGGRNLNMPPSKLGEKTEEEEKRGLLTKGL